MKDRTRRIGGTLQIESRAGAGTTVTVRMPTLHSKLPMHTSVLIVEDQYFSRLALRSILDSRQDFTIVGEATTGATGIDLFRQHKPT